MALTRREALMGFTGGAMLKGLEPLSLGDRNTYWVVLMLAGGADGLSIAPPYADPGYYRARPTIAVPPPTAGRDSTIALTPTVGLHPALADLHGLWERQELGILQGVAPDASPEQDSHQQARLQQLALCRKWLEAPASVPVEVPGLSALKRLALEILAGTAPSVSILTHAGWDSHVGQGGVTGPLAEQMSELASAVSLFVRDVGEQWRNTRVLITTEFGRSIAENSQGGTDHGSGFSMLVLGRTLLGGQALGMREACTALAGGQNAVPSRVALADALGRITMTA